MSIYVQLKSFREKAGLTVNEASEALKIRGIKKCSPKTIYGWERGHSEPPAETFMSLCDIYGVQDILSAFGYKNKKMPILTDEQTETYEKTIREIREASSEARSAANALLESLTRADKLQDNSEEG